MIVSAVFRHCFGWHWCALSMPSDWEWVSGCSAQRDCVRCFASVLPCWPARDLYPRVLWPPFARLPNSRACFCDHPLTRWWTLVPTCSSSPSAPTWPGELGRAARPITCAVAAWVARCAITWQMCHRGINPHVSPPLDGFPCCRYRLSVPAAKYAPWFGVVLKGARLAVKVLQLLSLEARASKLRCEHRRCARMVLGCWVHRVHAAPAAAASLPLTWQLHPRLLASACLGSSVTWRLLPPLPAASTTLSSAWRPPRRASPPSSPRRRAAVQNTVQRMVQSKFAHVVCMVQLAGPPCELAGCPSPVERSTPQNHPPTPPTLLNRCLLACPLLACSLTRWSGLWWPTARSSSTSSRTTRVGQHLALWLAATGPAPLLQSRVPVLRACCCRSLAYGHFRLAQCNRFTGSCSSNVLSFPPPSRSPAVKEVRNSAFVSALKERMAQLRHSKLYKQVGVAGLGYPTACIRGGLQGYVWLGSCSSCMHACLAGAAP